MNQVPLKKASEMTGNFYAVIFSPVDLSLADGSPKNRRKFLDAAISQLTPQYSGYLEQYERVLEQRNALLKDLYRFPALRDTIDIWDLQLAKLGTILSIYRNDYVKKLSKLSEKIYFGLSSESEKFSMCYRSSVFDQLPVHRNIWKDIIIYTALSGYKCSIFKIIKIHMLISQANVCLTEW